MSEEYKKIGIFGGTFNPIHIGHLIVAEAVRESFGLDRILFVPSGVPPHKSYEEVTVAEHRYAMVECAVRSNPYFEASRIEVDRAGFTYTVDTLNSLRGLYGKAAEIYFIIGADVVNELTTWKDFRKVFGLCRFIAVGRPGCDAASAESGIKRLKERYNISVETVEAPLIDISSTSIREYVKSRRSIKYLVPECVEEYIHINELYRD